MSSPSLLAQLNEVATVARRRLISNASRTYAQCDSRIDAEEYNQYSQTAAFLAFVDLGGNADAPDLFDFVGRKQELTRATEAQLRKLLRSDDQNITEEENRSRPRPDNVDETMWDVWKDAVTATEIGRASGDSAGQGARDGFVLGGLSGLRVQQEDDLREQELRALGAELARVLSPTDLDMITKHYLQGVPQRELAANLAQVDATYAGDAKRAETAINVRLHRARTRLRARLAPHWADMVRA